MNVHITTGDQIVYQSTELLEGKLTLRVDITFKVYSEADLTQITSFPCASSEENSPQWSLIDPEKVMKQAII